MTKDGSVIVVKKDDFINCMNSFIDFMATKKTNDEKQEWSKLKIIELTKSLITKDIYNGVYVDEKKLKPKKKALYRICERLGSDFYKTEHMSNMSFFVMIFLGVPYWSFETKKEQLSFF